MQMDPLALGAFRPVEDSPIVSNLHQSLWDMFIYDEPHPSDTLRFEGLPAFFGLTRIPTYVICIAIDDYERMAEEKRNLVCTHIKQAVKEALGEWEYLLIFAHQNYFYLCGHLSDVATQEVQAGPYGDRLAYPSRRALALAVHDREPTIGRGMER